MTKSGNTRKSRLRQWIEDWYEGKAYSINRPNDEVVILPGIRYRRHWTSKIAHAVIESSVEFFKKHGSQIAVGVIISVIAAGLITLASILFT